MIYSKKKMTLIKGPQKCYPVTKEVMTKNKKKIDPYSELIFKFWRNYKKSLVKSQ